jgi:hypothetical protein
VAAFNPTLPGCICPTADTNEEAIGQWADGDEAKGIAAAAVAGGTASAIGGGKFANGAFQGAFSYLFNELSREYFKAQVAFYDNSSKLTESERLSVQAAARRYAKQAIPVESLDGIVDWLKRNPYPYDRILLISHGGIGSFGMGDQGLNKNSEQLPVLRSLMSEFGKVYLMGCLVGFDQAYLDSVAAAMNADSTAQIKVYGPTYFNNIDQTTGRAWQTLYGQENEKPIRGYPWSESK